MKRICSALLAAALCLSLCTPAFAAEPVAVVDPTEFTDAAEITQWKAVAALCQLGVISGKDDGAFHPADPVTRAEAAKLVYLLAKGGKDKDFSPRDPDRFDYSDTANHWARKYIQYGRIRQYIKGRGDGSFDPDGDVTVLEFAKMLLVVMNDDPQIYAVPDGYAWGYLTDEHARNWNLYDGLPEELIPIPSAVPYEGCETVPLTRENAAQMLYTALQKQAGLDLGQISDPAEDVGEFTSEDWDGTRLTIIQAVFHYRSVDSLSIPAQPTNRK